MVKLADFNQISNFIKRVDIDDNGVFKYVLLHLQHTPSKEELVFLRGYADCEYHKNIKQKFEQEIREVGIDLHENNIALSCSGGGRISFDHPYLKVYGFSYGYGKGNHEKAKELLLLFFDNKLKIDTSDDGY